MPTSFGVFAIATLLTAVVVGVFSGVVAAWVSDTWLAWMGGGLAFAPLFLIVGRVWAKSEMLPDPPPSNAKEG